MSEPDQISESEMARLTRAIEADGYAVAENAIPMALVEALLRDHDQPIGE